MIHRLRSGSKMLVWVTVVVAAVVAIVIAAAGCGSGAHPAASPAPTISPISSASPTPPATSPAPTATSPAPTDARALLLASATAMDAKAHTASFSGTFAATTTRNGETSVVGMNLAGDMASNGESIRCKGTMTLRGLTMSVEFIGLTVEGRMVGYARIAGLTGWTQLPSQQSDISTTNAQDIRAMLASAKQLKIVRAETVGGVLCDVVHIDLDLAAYDKASKNLGFADSVRQELKMSAAAAAAALQGATGTEVLWIGRSDQLLYRDAQDYVVHAGPRGSYEEKGSMDCSDFGKVVAPPITAPTLSPTPTPSPTGPSV